MFPLFGMVLELLGSPTFVCRWRELHKSVAAARGCIYIVYLHAYVFLLSWEGLKPCACSENEVWLSGWPSSAHGLVNQEVTQGYDV